MRTALRILLAITLVLTTAAVFIAVRIEVYRVHVRRTPKAAMAELFPKWDFAPSAATAAEEPPKPAPRQEAISQNTRRTYLDQVYRSFVSQWGLLQYILAPLAMSLSALLMVAADKDQTLRLSSGLCLVAAVVCTALMLHRGYLGIVGG